MGKRAILSECYPQMRDFVMEYADRIALAEEVTNGETLTTQGRAWNGPSTAFG